MKNRILKTNEKIVEHSDPWMAWRTVGFSKQ
jgi:hypothetical protein